MTIRQLLKPFASEKEAAECARTRALWLEVSAVLAFGIMPSLSNAVMLWLFPNRSVNPYWADALDIMVTNACICFAVLYLMSRSGESWVSFGFARPRLVDLPVGLVIFLISVLSWRMELLLPTTELTNYQ